jgi:hypothetical protein
MRDSSERLRSWSKKNLASARRGRTTRSLPPITALGSAGLMLLTTRNLLVSLPAAVEQREVFLVGLHGQNQAFLRHRGILPQTGRSAHSAVRPAQ